MKKVIFALLLLFPFMSSAQTFVLEKEDKTNETILKGQCRYADLLAQPDYTWMKDTARYLPDATAMQVLKKELSNYNLVVLFGSWCSDSHLQLPHLYKVLQEANMPMEKVQLYGMDRAKKGRDVEDKIFKVDRVPTIILYKNNQEVGRIVETPQRSLEADLVAMIEGDSR